MELLFSVIFAWIATISVVLLSLIYVLRKVAGKNKDGSLYKLNRALRKHHKLIGIIAIVSGLLHGIYSSLPILTGNKGTLAFVVIIILGLSYMFRKKLKGKWAKSHRVLAALTCLLVVLHVLEVGGFVGIDGLASALGENSEVATETVISEKNQEVLSDGLVFADGVYVGRADAYGPDLETEVIVEGGLIVSVEVISHNEDKVSIYGEAMENVPLAIVNENSVEVDSVSGATFTSYGIMMSVENALENAVVEGSLPGVEMPSISKKKRH